MFVQFVSLYYYEYLSEQIHQFKKTLAVETDNPAHDTKQVMNAD